MVETFVALGLARRFILGQQADEFVGQQCGVYHLPLGIAGVNVAAANDHLGTGRVEVLILQFAHFAAIHGVGPGAAKFLDIEQVGASSNLFVGIEGDANASVLNLGVSHQIGHGCDNLGNAGFVIGTEQRGSVGADDVLVPAQITQIEARHIFGVLVPDLHPAAEDLYEVGDDVAFKDAHVVRLEAV